MMSKRIFALLVGINQYPEDVSNLRGCVQDVLDVQDMLMGMYQVPAAHIVTLTDQEANRKNFIHAFRSHFKQARQGDTIFFHYSGHGSRENASKEFWPYFPEKKNETLVLADSRTPGGLDLADKELALLLHELAPLQADIVLGIDACHAGSITRKESDLLQQRKRQSEREGVDRSLEEYLEGQYQQMLKREGEIYIPRTKHLVMSACSQFQSAYETKENKGAFTTALLASLQNTELTYSEVFSQANIKIKQWAYNQNPVIYPAEGFNTFCRFLTQEESKATFYPNVYFAKEGKEKQWIMEMGAIQGVPTDSEEPGVLEVLTNEDQVVGKATIAEVLTDKSVILVEEGVPLEPSQTYKAKITHLPVAQMQVSLDGSQLEKDLFKNEFGQKNALMLQVQEDLPFALYRVNCTEKDYLIEEGETQQLIYGVTQETGKRSVLSKKMASFKELIQKAAIHQIVQALEHITRWHQLLQLKNQRAKINPAKVRFKFEQQDAGENWIIHPLQHTIYLSQPEERVRYRLAVYNDTHQTLYATQVELTENFQILLNDQVTLAPKSDTILTEPKSWAFTADRVEKAKTHLLIISTEQLNNPIIPNKKGLALGQIATLKGTKIRALASRIGNRRYPSTKNDWFTHLMQIKMLKEQQRLENQEQVIQFEDAIIQVRGHALFKPKVVLESIFRRERQEPAYTLKKALQASGWRLVTLLQREVEDWKKNKIKEVLELLTLFDATATTQVNHEHPLKIQLDVLLNPGETLMALSFYGDQVHVLGETSDSAELLLTRLISHPDRSDLCQICFAKGKKEDLEVDLA